MRQMKIFFTVVIFMFLFSACNGTGGGDDGGGDNTPVAPSNNAPVITSAPVTTATAGVAYSYDVDATDLDGDTLYYVLLIEPNGMTIDVSTGVISWTPTLTQFGERQVKVSVNDGNISVDQEFVITVLPPPNNAPVITSTAITTAIAGTEYSYNVEATDADNNTLEYSLLFKPVGMTINTGTGLITWNPTVAQIGDHSVRVIVDDGIESCFQDFVVTVLAPNNEPVVSSIPITNAISTELYIYDVNATDVDGDTLSYDLQVFPVGMVINNQSGVINWIPGNSQVGDHTIKISINDGIATVFQEYVLTVSLPPANQTPIITSIPVTLAYADTIYHYDVNATDLDGDILNFVLVDGATGMSIDSTNGELDWQPSLTQVGNHWIEIKVTDGETSDYQQFTVRVSPTYNGLPFIRACTLVSWWYTDYSSLTVEDTLLIMKDNGCDTVLVLVTQYVDAIDSTTVYSVYNKTPTDAGITNVTNFAHSLGMNVYLKPHVDIWNSNIWRGYITFSNEADWTAWWASYNTFISHYLDLAETIGAEGFVIGTELVGTEHRDTDWRNIVALGRSKFSGYIFYGANHDSYQFVTWWDAVDAIGISAYFPLTSLYDPTLAQLNAGWLPWISALDSFANTWNMDVLFLEIGYMARNGTNREPWELLSSSLDEQEQADCYQAAFESLYHQTWFKGMSWWMWNWDPTQFYYSYDVYNHPAEDVLRWWYAGQ